MYEHILENRTLYHFYQICQIPHESHKEEALSNYLRQWAENLGLEVYQDSYWNLIIKKPASAECEGMMPVILQAHMDMVCDQEPGGCFDFQKDAILWKVEGDWITSAAGTTLGADCGIGVALILTMLEADDYSHPPIEAVLTTCEETDMSGAYHLEFERLKGKRMINLDTSPDGKILAGSCGGVALEFALHSQWIPARTELEFFDIAVQGLEGGHSGHDITKGRNNAILLLGHLLRSLYHAMPELRMVDFCGGNSRSAIPREAFMTIALPVGMAHVLKNSLEDFQMDVKEEVSHISNIQFTCERSKEQHAYILDEDTLKRFCDLLILLPNGIREMSGLVSGVVESSCNLGILRVKEDNIFLVSEVRNNYESTQKEIVNQFAALARLLEGEIHLHSVYHPWCYQADSALRQQIQDIYRKTEKKEIKIEVAHAGNEIGIFCEAIAGLDAVAMGPTRLYYHSPHEKLSISSSVRFEAFLKRLLSELKQ